jgi:hypothetical protein
VYASSGGQAVKLRQAPYVDNTPSQGSEVPYVLYNTIAGEIPDGEKIGDYVATVQSTVAAQIPLGDWYKVRINSITKKWFNIEDDWDDGDNIYYVRTDVARRGN